MYVMFRRCLLLAALLLWPAPLQAQDAGADLVRRVNSLRASLGLPGMRLNNTLGVAARSQARWMAESGLIRHTRPDGTDLRARTRSAGYPSTWVAEIIYMGGGVENAWNFWLGSRIHYETITGPSLQELGVGYASAGRRTAYVIVFGNPGGAAVTAGNSGSVAGPPSYVRGRDARGFIMHEIQPGDTLGLIALIYGYSWDDLPYMRTVNGLEGDLLQPGEIFLVPPADGTYTPTAGTPATATLEAATATAASTATATPRPVATSASLPPALALAARAPLASATPVPLAAANRVADSGAPLWVILALAAQAALLGLAAIIFALRGRRRR